jgi:DNA-binding transcriptional LysR family regulator
MDFRRLRYFLAVAQAGSVSRAALRLGIAQPPLSQQIRRLEAELGVRLFERLSRGVQLTVAGRALLDEGVGVLARAERASEVARRAGRGETGRLRIGFVGTAAYSVLGRIIRSFRTRRPGVELLLYELTSVDQVRALRDGRIDVGFVRPPVDAAELQVRTVTREPLVVALPRGHPLTRRRRLSLRALAGEAFVMSPRELGPGFYDRIVALCRRAGFSPTVSQQAIQMQTIAGLVAAGIGVSVVPLCVSQLRIQGTEFRPLQDAGAWVEIAALWRDDDPSPVLASFLDVIW